MGAGSVGPGTAKSDWVVAAGELGLKVGVGVRAGSIGCKTTGSRWAIVGVPRSVAGVLGLASALHVGVGSVGWLLGADSGEFLESVIMVIIVKLSRL